MQKLDLDPEREIEYLEAHVQRRLTGRVRELRLLAEMGGIVMKGQVHTYYAKQLAQQALMEVATLPILSNDIEVA